MTNKSKVVRSKSRTMIEYFTITCVFSQSNFISLDINISSSQSISIYKFNDERSFTETYQF